MGPLNSLEEKLADVYKGSPPLAQKSKNSIVGVLPNLSLLLGILQLVGLWSLWHWGHTHSSDATVLYNNNGLPSPQNLNIFYWIGILMTILEAGLLIGAYNSLKARLRLGWRLVLYSALLNVVYAVITVLDNYGDVIDLIFNVLVSAVILYFIFQIRDQYALVGIKDTSRVGRRQKK